MAIPSLTSLITLLGLSFFFGLAFEQFYAGSADKPPGGVRTFPLLAIAGGTLYLLDTADLLPLTGGILILGGWLFAFYRHDVAEPKPEKEGPGALLVPVCNLLAFLLGPMALAAPAWLAVGIGVTAVLLLTAREQLHALARRVDNREIITAAEFLLLTGLVLPVLPDTPVTDLTPITPFKAWLALVAVCALSYASYLVHRHLMPKDGDLWIAILGGFYSSTATTIVLARRVKQQPRQSRRAGAGIVLATTVMYLRLIIVVGIFNLDLVKALAPPLAILFVAGGLLAAFQYRLTSRPEVETAEQQPPRNPLELGSATLFAALFVLVSLVSGWVMNRYGQGGMDIFAAVVGVTDIDPFVLSIAQGSTAAMSVSGATTAILIASASNNMLKAIYAAGFAGLRASAAAIASLVALGALAVIIGLAF